MSFRLFIISILIFISSLALANSTSVAITPQDRAAHCAEMGGVDITNKSTESNNSSMVVCEINNDAKFEHYFKTNHPNQTIKNPPLNHNPSNATGYVASVPNGFYDYNNPSERWYEFVYYVTGNGTTSSTVSGRLYIQNEARCGWNCYYYDDPVSITADKDDINKKVVTSIQASRGGSTMIYCTAQDTVGNICIHNTYSTLGDSRMDGVITHYVDANNELSIDRSLGEPDQPPSCNLPSSYVGNPINMATGNKYQKEIAIAGTGAYPLSFIASYNSLNSDKNKAGLWTHNYAMHINTTQYNPFTFKLIAVGSDGKQRPFYFINDQIKTVSTELGGFKKTADGYQYVSPFHETYDFDASGNLIRTTNNGGLVHNIKHISDTQLVVSDTFGHSLTITETKDHQPLSVKSSSGITVNYEYDGENRLIKMTKEGKSRTYHYEDSNFPRNLTGITDENGIRYVTWTYDTNGRANSSYHIGDKDKVGITYNSNTQTTMTNPLGRRSVYNYGLLDGLKLITSINGQASSLCPVINSSYEYNNRGLVTMATNGRGVKTQYNYNAAGQETSRVVGYGSANAVTIKTTWDDRFFGLPKTETYPDKVITYDYDNKGNLVNRTVSAN